MSSKRQPANLRLALILLSVAGVFFLGIVLKFIFFPTH
ncbi:MAG: cytochrome oxidase small assembly protein [Burkholderiaceae bacterium]